METIDVPEDVYDALNVPEDRRDEVLREELAITLYREGILSFGNARELAGRTHREFQTLLGDRGVERHYTSEELAEDIEYARR
jgi:predicted HTH domain antitoxin